MSNLQRYLDRQLKELKAAFKTFMDSIITGSCGCVRTIKIYYLLPDMENCNITDPNDRVAMMNNNYQNPYIGKTDCDYKETCETTKVAAFFGMDMYKSYLIRKPEGMAQTIVDETNRDKLIVADRIQFTEANVNTNIYKRAGDPEPCGWSDDSCTTYYMIMWKKTGEN